MKKALFTFLVVIAGCATGVKPVTGPDGSPHLLVKCAEIEDCYSMSQKACNGTYKIVNQSTWLSGAGQEPALLIKCEH
ncbi:MAG: hypothetical protein ACXVCP_11095 [Bdellovibrio sp.]